MKAPSVQSTRHRHARASRAAIAAAGLIGAAAIGCSHSNPTQPTTGTGTGGGRGRLVDTFAFNVVGSKGWKISVGDIATYLLSGDRTMGVRGEIGAGPQSAPVRGSGAAPIHIRPRLLLDTVAVNDTLSGPPAGTDLVTPGYMTFDAKGGLWMSVAGSHGDGSVVEYTRSQTSQSGSLTPMVTLTGSRTPLGLAFDAKGQLWVVDSSTTTLLGYTTLELETGGRAADTVSLAGITAAGATWAPLGLAIDQHGDVWVSAGLRSGSGTAPAFIVTEFTAAAIQAGGTPTPTLTLVATGSSTAGYGPAMAFDTAGNLWTANANAGTVTEFTVAALTAGANPSPALTVSGASLIGVGDLWFDGDDLLFVGGSAYGTPGAGIFTYLPSMLTTSGSPAPALSYMPANGVTHFAIH